MPRLNVLIQTCADGRVIARVPDLWGCLVTAPDRQRALELLDTQIPDHLEWRRDTGYPVSLGHGKRSLVIAEERHVEAEETIPGDDPIFEWDRQPLPEADLNEALNICSARLKQLEGLTIDLHPRVIAWESPELNQSVESVLETLDSWLATHLSQLGSRKIKSLTRSPLDRLTATFVSLISVLQTLDDKARNWEYAVPGNCGQRRGDWTIRKLLRRMAEIETEAVQSIRQIIRAYQAG